MKRAIVVGADVVAWANVLSGGSLVVYERYVNGNLVFSGIGKMKCRSQLSRIQRQVYDRVREKRSRFVTAIRTPPKRTLQAGGTCHYAHGKGKSRPLKIPGFS